MSESRVVKRKTHTKSRNGCLQCKQRHTKCNETRPRCANCVRLDIPCVWPNTANGFSSSPQQQSPNSHPSPYAEPAPSATPDLGSDLPLADLRLLHHWTTTCAKSLHPSIDTRITEVWSNEFVEIGFDYPFLLRGFLAISAVHKASCLPPGDRQSLLLQADSHISRSLDTYRKHLESPSADTAIAMFMLSSVLLTYNFASAQLEKPDDPIGALHHCFMLLKGIKTVVVPHWETIKHSSAFAYMTSMSSEKVLEDLDELAKDDKDEQMLTLIELTELLLDTQDKDACTSAINELHRMSLRFHHLYPGSDEYSLLFLWPARVTDRFFDLLAAKNPVSCIICIHFAALLAKGRPVWWLQKWPQWLLTASEQLLAATPDLLKWLAWPQQVINSQICG
ncbi:hypothetical protein IQ07DRAFT_307291 [Pyrenochaeta sp. DS3sAY3a]|nr:hypothetical protein IQ07DRAFT_307291 [Pyrenochaeta sp. DS3sAY3a]